MSESGEVTVDEQRDGVQPTELYPVQHGRKRLAVDEELGAPLFFRITLRLPRVGFFGPPVLRIGDENEVLQNRISGHAWDREQAGYGRANQPACADVEYSEGNAEVHGDAPFGYRQQTGIAQESQSVLCRGAGMQHAGFCVAATCRAESVIICREKAKDPGISLRCEGTKKWAPGGAHSDHRAVAGTQKLARTPAEYWVTSSMTWTSPTTPHIGVMLIWPPTLPTQVPSMSLPSR
jgi:hypothetical protein